MKIEVDFLKVKIEVEVLGQEIILKDWMTEKKTQIKKRWIELHCSIFLATQRILLSYNIEFLLILQHFDSSKL